MVVTLQFSGKREEKNLKGKLSEAAREIAQSNLPYMRQYVGEEVWNMPIADFIAKYKWVGVLFRT